MIHFILNNQDISTDLPAGTLLLDFIRYNQHLTGTKIGCREGDCGACTVLIGTLKDNELTYQSATSCLTALGNIHGKHIVTIEGTNLDDLNPIQQAMCDESGTQCGFCTPGFVVSMAVFCLSKNSANQANALAAVDGNICRCTGYKSIERALEKVTNLLEKRQDTDPIDFVTKQNILPQYFLGIAERLQKLHLSLEKLPSFATNAKFLGGGTDLYVQQHDAMVYADIDFLVHNPDLKGITIEENQCVLGGSTTVTEMVESPIINDIFPKFKQYSKLVSSTPIRNIATLAGNFTNASPIGDFSIFFLALDAHLILTNSNGETRELPLKNFYLGYKKLAKSADEYISKIKFEIPPKTADFRFNFEKVSKRTHLDIASVNTACKIILTDNIITEANLSAGGVNPIPTFLQKTSDFLLGKAISEETINEAIAIAQTEISPISDARGTEKYKGLLLGQLIKAHFYTIVTQ